MGDQLSKPIVYSLPLQGTDSPDCTCIHRSYYFPDEIIESFVDKKINNTWDFFRIGASISRNLKCIGSREKLNDNTLGKYTWKTYSEVEKCILSIGYCLIKNDLCPALYFDNENEDEEKKNEKKKEIIDEEKQNIQNEHIQNEGKKSKKHRFLGLYSKNREEWLICEYACSATGIVVVPLYDTLGNNTTNFIIDQTEMCTVAASDVCAEKLLNLPERPACLKNIIIFDPIKESLKEKAKEINVNLLSFQDLLEEGEKVENKEDILKEYASNKEDINTLCYTSGTTGDPKGVLMTHRNFISVVCALYRGTFRNFHIDVSPADTHISYLPMAHIFERIICTLMITAGGAIGFYSGDTMKLIDDIAALKPTVFCSVPRLFNRINDKINQGLKDHNAFSRYLFNKAVNSKLSRIHENATTTHLLWDQLVFKKISQSMGGRVRYMITGSAPLDAAVQEKIKTYFCCPLIEGYGMTESLGASFLVSPSDTKCGHIGGPIPCVEFKLISVPEMDYFVHDHSPKGELLMRGPSISPGYFRNKKATDETFKNGWLHTGDIAVLLPNGSLRIIDRRKNIFKLAQGEYVAPEKIESKYAQSTFVSQIFVYGYSSKPVLVGVVVPDEHAANRWAKNNNKNYQNLSQICNDEQFKQAIFHDINEIGKANHLLGFELVKDIFLTPESFTVENEFLTPTFKLKRHNAFIKYKKEIDEMYEKLEK